MKIAVLQLSDIHIVSDQDFILKHKDEFWRSCKHLVNECTKMLIVITGDIAYHGKKEEYDIAYTWLKECEEKWKSEARFLNSVEYIIVPGNHDCLFENDAIRKVIIEKVLQNDSLQEIQYAESCLNVQTNFWDFYKRLRSDIIGPEISWSHNVQIKLGLNIKFNCYNTAFLSQIEEKPGDLLIPEDKFIHTENNHNNDIIISLFHHNTGWLSPNTSHNNKKTFEQHLYTNSNIVMCGHEHSNRHQLISNIGEYKELIYLENAAFQCNNNSEYGLLIINTEENSISRYSYSYNGETYIEAGCSTFPINQKRTGILLNTDWADELDKHHIPLKHARKDNLVLSDIFVYPDLEPLSDIHSKYMQYVDSETLLGDTIPERVIILEGESQSGKSSLLQMLYSSK